jgi:ABC-type branched-subunit amino acid transport system substrate-binding protein
MSPIQSPVQIVTQVASAAADTLLLAANASRLKASIFNDSTSKLYVKLGGSGASSTSKSFEIAAGGYFEVFDSTAPIYGNWASANGFAYLTDYQ